MEIKSSDKQHVRFQIGLVSPKKKLDRLILFEDTINTDYSRTIRVPLFGKTYHSKDPLEAFFEGTQAICKHFKNINGEPYTAIKHGEGQFEPQSFVTPIPPQETRSIIEYGLHA